jgi:hypothetical protein
MKKPPVDVARVNLRVSRQLYDCLGELAALGVHGVTHSEVAWTLVVRGVEELWRDGILTRPQRAVVVDQSMSPPRSRRQAQ